MRTLGIKLILFVILIFLTFTHSFILGRRLESAVETLGGRDTEETPRRDWTKCGAVWAIVSSLTGIISLLVLLAAVALRMGNLKGMGKGWQDCGMLV